MVLKQEEVVQRGRGMTGQPSSCALGLDAVKAPPLPATVAVSPSRLHNSLGLGLLYLSFGFACCALDGLGSAGELGKNIKLIRSIFFLIVVFLGGTINAASDRN